MEEDNKKKKELMKKAREILLIVLALVIAGLGYKFLIADKTGQNNQGAEQQKIKVIQYQSKYLPLDQLEVVSHSGCENVSHYHAKDNKGVTATDGANVPDPGPDCGYGKVSDLPTTEINKP